MIRSDIQLHLDEWHYIEASKYDQMASLIVNNRQPVIGQSFGTFMFLSLDGNFSEDPCFMSIILECWNIHEHNARIIKLIIDADKNKDN